MLLRLRHEILLGKLNCLELQLHLESHICLFSSSLSKKKTFNTFSLKGKLDVEMN